MHFSRMRGVYHRTAMLARNINSWRVGRSGQWRASQESAAAAAAISFMDGDASTPLEFPAVSDMAGLLRECLLFIMCDDWAGRRGDENVRL